jgi:type II secretory pathway pseudopilin PulG
MSAGPQHRPRSAAGFTLVEILLVIAAILILISMLIAAVSVVSKSVHKAAITSMVQNLQAAVNLYQLEDPQHRFPPMDAGNYLYSNWNQTGGQPQRTLDLLLTYKVAWTPSQLNPPLAWMVNPALYLNDNFGRPYCYTCDTVVGGVVTNSAPWGAAPQPSDWNAKNEHPYAYVWSYGQPTGKGDANDEDPTKNIANWIYVKTSP